MDSSFYNWSIPKYFMTNYMKPQFHSSCSEKQGDWVLGEHFIYHLESYLINSYQFRGKWIQEFIVRKDFIKEFSQGKLLCTRKQSNGQYQSLMTSLSLRLDHLLFIAFIAQFFRIIYHLNQVNLNDQELESLSQLYFCYRLEISFQNENDIGEPPQLIKLINLIQKNLSKLGSNLSQQLMKKIAKACQFQNVVDKLIFEDKEMKKSQEYLSSPEKNVQKKKEKDIDFKSPQFKKFRFEDKFLIKNTFKQAQKIENMYIDAGKNKDIYCEKAKSKIIKHTQTSRKIIKTTRFSNFKGTFNKKLSHVGNEKKFDSSPINTNSESYSNIEKKNDEIEKPKQMKKKRERDIQEDYEYFLCDRSF